ncbi:MAG: hypothetical protein ABSG82_04160 [Sedimentisphaerales bacterium]|jgi:hypothetical protein
MVLYNRILLHEPPFFRQIDKRTLIRDASSFPFIIEEIISFGAISVAIPATSLASLAIDSIEPCLKKRIRTVDKNLRIARMDRTIRRSINDEFGLYRLHGGGAFTFKKELSPDICNAVCSLEAEWYNFLLGLEYGLQIDIDINRLKRSVTLLRTHSKTPEARATLATFEGVLSTYKAHEVGVIKMAPVAHDDLIQFFEAFLEDETYQDMSEQFHDLGFARRSEARLSRIWTLSKRLIRKKAFKNAIDLGTTSVTLATQIPLPETDLGERLLSKKYLPTTISLQRAIKRANNAWKKSGCELVSLKESGQSLDP